MPYADSPLVVPRSKRLYTPPTILITDVDGVLGPHGSRTASYCTPEVMERFGKRMPVGLASGKPMDYIKEYCEENGINPDFLVAEGGGVLEMSDGQRAVFRNGGSVQGFREAVYHDRDTGALDIPFGENDGEKETVFTMFTTPNYLPELLAYAERKIQYMGLPLKTIPHPDAIDIMPVGLDKTYGIDKAAEALGFYPEQALAIGDGLNDIEMLEHCGTPAAVGNAKKKVKKLVKKKGGILASSSSGEGVKEIYETFFDD